jgi:hypothetical protein
MPSQSSKLAFSQPSCCEHDYIINAKTRKLFVLVYFFFLQLWKRSPLSPIELMASTFRLIHTFNASLFGNSRTSNPHYRPQTYTQIPYVEYRILVHVYHPSPSPLHPVIVISEPLMELCTGMMLALKFDNSTLTVTVTITEYLGVANGYLTFRLDHQHYRFLNVPFQWATSEGFWRELLRGISWIGRHKSDVWEKSFVESICLFYFVFLFYTFFLWTRTLL